VFFFIVKPVDALTKRIGKPEAEAGPSDEERRHQELLAAIRGLPH
jgi:large-conductance mechanosensitive channel